MYDFVIDGTGYGSSVMDERFACDFDTIVLLVYRRPNLTGKAYDYSPTNGKQNMVDGPRTESAVMATS